MIVSTLTDEFFKKSTVKRAWFDRPVGLVLGLFVKTAEKK